MTQTADIDWTADGVPRSRRFDDIYFSREGGLDETRAVFLQGCGLPEAWRGRRQFVIGELGFGTGLNILALLELWRANLELDSRLNIFSIEAYPLDRRAAERALCAWPELGDLAGPLIAAWPRAPGFHRIDWPDLCASLDVAIGEAAPSLEAWQGRADAWFLDGFSPARNPEMWRQDVLGLVGQRSAPGAVAATFTVAGAVRRGLQAEGFEVSKLPGYGRKGQRLEARLPGPRSAAQPAPASVCILGAGVAGAALARAFRIQGAAVTVVDRSGPGAGASGNPAALVTPRFDAGGGPSAQLHAQAFARARAIYESETPAAIIARGALQLETAARDGPRFDRIAASDLFEPRDLQRLDGAEASARLGDTVEAGGLWLEGALVIEPAVAIAGWLEGCVLTRGRAARVEPFAGGWRVFGPDGEVIAEAEAVCLAGGFETAALAPGLALKPVRGQASLAAWPEPVTAAAWGGYAIPTRRGLLFGATHDRGVIELDVRAEDHRRNLELLARRRPSLASALADADLDGRAGVRAATPDHSPLAGPLAEAPGLHVLTGLGGRGFTLAPLAAEHVAALAMGAPSPLPQALARSLDPNRFSPGSDGRQEDRKRPADMRP